MKDVNATEHAAQLEKVQRHITEICDLECHESTHEWHRRRELTVHDQWVAGIENRLRGKVKNNQEPQHQEPIQSIASQADAANIVTKNHDYTEWQREHWSDKSIEEIHALATEHEKSSAK